MVLDSIVFGGVPWNRGLKREVTQVKAKAHRVPPNRPPAFQILD
jgi:hypothetical protein